MPNALVIPIPNSVTLDYSSPNYLWTVIVDSMEAAAESFVTALMNNPDFNSWLMSRVPSKRWGRPDELVGAAIFLGSSASDYVNGQIIYADGGMVSVL